VVNPASRTPARLLSGRRFQGDEAVELGVFGFVDHTHANDAIVRDGLADHAQACYGGSMPKSMKAEELAYYQNSCCYNIATTLTTQQEIARGSLRERSWCKHLITTPIVEVADKSL
jgi:hypothetical protein